MNSDYIKNFIASEDWTKLKNYYKDENGEETPLSGAL
jgi:hypothetical protein